MITFAVSKSNRAKVESPDKLRLLLSNRVVSPIHFDIRCDSCNPSTCSFALSYDGWPLAIKRELLREDLPKPACDQIIDAYGENGFNELLADIAPLLETDFKVQAFCVSVTGEGTNCLKAREWLVRPGSSNIAIKEIGSLERSTPFNSIAGKPTAPIQFNWRRWWSSKVAPYLDEELVKHSLDLGMSKITSQWKRGDAPWREGRDAPQSEGMLVNRIHYRGKLSWFQPIAQSHAIAFFAMAIGVLNYPDLEWRFRLGESHMVPVGCDDQNRPRVVMDILRSDDLSAEESLALADTLPSNPKYLIKREALRWTDLCMSYLANVVPALKRRARAFRD